MVMLSGKLVRRPDKTSKWGWNPRSLNALVPDTQGEVSFIGSPTEKARGAWTPGDGVAGGGEHGKCGSDSWVSWGNGVWEPELYKTVIHVTEAGFL